MGIESHLTRQLAAIDSALAALDHVHCGRNQNLYRGGRI